MRIWGCLSMCCMVVIMSGCGVGANSSAEQTLMANNQQMGTDIAIIRATATVEADRVLITIEHAQTLVREVDNQGTRVQSTLDSRGLGGASAPIVTGQPNVIENPIFTAPASNEAAPGLTPSVVIATASSDATGPQFANVVMSTSVGADDCATGISSSFSSSNSEIYVVATAVNVPAGTNIVSRWRLEGVEVALHDWTPSFNIETPACIWFYIDQPTTVFTPGNWTVEIEANGSVMSAPTAFTIVGDVMQAEVTPGA